MKFPLPVLLASYLLLSANAWAGQKSAYSTTGALATKAIVAGPEFLVNTVTNDDQAPFYAEMANDGSFEIHWSDGLSIFDYAFYGAKFDAKGNLMEEDFPVMYSPGALAKNPSDGTYLQAMVDSVKDYYYDLSTGEYSYSSTWGLFYRKLSDYRSIISHKYLVYETGGSAPTIAVTTDGSFLLGWRVDTSFFIQRFDSNNQPFGDRLQINSSYIYRIAMAQDGSFALAWYDPNDGNIFVQLFDSMGKAQGSKFQVNSYTEYSLSSAYGYRYSIAMAPNGSFVVAWASTSSQEGADYDVYARLYIAPPVVTEEPPVVTEEPPVVTEEPPVVTEEPPVVTEEPPVVTEEPPVVTNIDNLVAELFASGCISNAGVANAVESSYYNAISLKSRSQKAAGSALNGVINMIEAQRGRHICVEGANQLIDEFGSQIE